MIAAPSIATPALACPGCRAPLDGEDCTACGATYPSTCGMPDLRLEADRFLDLLDERAKAGRLERIAPGVDLAGLAEAYYAMTPDVDPARRRLYLAHIRGAEARGSALAALLPRQGRIVEVGCGTGGLIAAARKLGLAIEGVDIASRWLVVARRRLDDLGLDAPLIAASAGSLPYADASVDAIVADSLLEHLDDPSRAVREWARVLRPGGTVLAWSPNRRSLGGDPHVRLWGLGLLPRAWMPAYVRLRRGGAWPPRCLAPGEVARMAEAAGFEGVEVEAPAIPPAWALGRSAPQRLAIGLANAARRVPVAAGLLREFGPLWQLRATRKGAA